MDILWNIWDFLAANRDLIVIQTVNGIVTGMILALVASGLTLIFGIMDVVNFAHGELFMLGAYIGVVVLATSGSFWIALVLSILDRGEGAAELYAAAGVPFRSLFRAEEFLRD